MNYNHNNKIGAYRVGKNIVRPANNERGYNFFYFGKSAFDAGLYLRACVASDFGNLHPIDHHRSK